MASKSVTFSGTTKPAGIVDTGQTGTSAVTGGVINCGTIPGTPTNSAPYFGAALDGTPMASSLYTATVVDNVAADAYYEPCGVACGFDSAGVNGLLFLMCALSNYEGTCQMVTKVGSTYTVVYTDSGTNSLNGLSSVVMSVQITYNGSHYVYTPSLNGTVITAAIFTDTAGVLGTPGSYFGAAFQPLYVSGTQYNPNGLTGWSAADAGGGVVTPTNQFFALL